MKHTIISLIQYAELNNVLVFIDEKYQRIPDLREIQRKHGSSYQFELVFANSITALHLKTISK